MDVEVLSILFLHDVLAVADVGDVVDLGTSHRGREAGVLGDVQAIDRAGDVKCGAFRLESVEDPALVLGFMLSSDRGGSKLLRTVAGVREGVSVRLEYKIPPLGQVATDAFETVLVDQGVFFSLLAVRNAGDVLAAGAAAGPLNGAESIVQSNNVTIGILDRRRGLR